MYKGREYPAPTNDTIDNYVRTYAKKPGFYAKSLFLRPDIDEETGFLASRA